MTKTSPATPIAYASASRANGGNVVDSRRGRAFVTTSYPPRPGSIRRCPGVPGPAYHFHHALGRRQPCGGIVSLHRPRALVARVQRTSARARRERVTAAVGAREVPRDLQLQSRRVLPGAGVGPEGTARSRHPPHVAGRHRPGRAAERDSRPRRRARDPAGGRVHEGRRGPRCRRPAIEFCDWHELDDDARAQITSRVRRPHLPGAHAARGRPCPSFPVHLEPLAQPRGRRARRQHRRTTIRPREGAAAAPALRRGARQLAVRRARAGDRRAPRRALPGHGGARALRVPRHARRRLRALRRRRGPARRDGVRAAAAHEVRGRGAPRGRRRHDPRGAAPALPRARARGRPTRT